ncbi:MAG: HAMP domain-containing histidine kinase [Oscillospiraceae bacterium]|nr:HAMP domain-containing histidine kinase [Oscillospiraceae bacterium]
MRKSVFFRSFLVTACMLIICFVAFGVIMFVMGRSVMMQDKAESLYTNADEVKRFTEAMGTEGDLDSLVLRMNLSIIAQCTGNHILLCDEEGSVVTSSDESRVSPYVGMEIDDAVLAAVREEGTYVGLTDLNGVYDGLCYVVAESIETPGGELMGYVIVSYPSSGFFRAWSGFFMMFILVAVAVLIVAVLLEYANARRLAQPLLEMSEAAHSFARGDYSVRITPYQREDEIGTLTEAFNAMAESLERNESRRQEFVANASHELRTPMTSIAGFADGLLDGTIPQSEEKKYLQTISSETKRLSRLVRSMLDMSRLQDGGQVQMQKFDLTEMVVQTLLNFEERVDGKGMNVELNVPEGTLPVMGDLDSLTRVVYNLIDNAIKFADKGTELVISIWKEEGRAYTRIQDTGATIPRTELPLIFDRFHKADRSRGLDREGVGLGLYMVRQILAAHDQDIFVTSEDGVTAFTFTLALAEERKT